MEPVDATVLSDLVGRGRRSPAPALRAPADARREYDYRRFCTNAWKVGNFLHHLGVRSGVGVGVADDPVPEPVLALFGAAALGAPVSVLDSERVEENTRAVVVPSGHEGRYDLPPGGRRVVYGDAPTDPSVAYFERDVWSQNPTEPPDIVAPDAVALRQDDTSYTHAALLAAARDVVERWTLGPGDEVAIRASLTHPGTVVAGVLAPLLAGGVVVLPDAETTADRAVGVGPEPDALAPDDVL